eukprot:CAMPEP_0206016832 /NCGR_PEP_ID=MMETSP1464-20131121/23690_1 /ASSEMBLY_ACC=CAM_ASM_001124 /TAXON_ID=119497 /ORGANISM="Exanthemachrysis gayraliae, Strain RCC1523" /LENGTH=85 /DNA_ID=CAMNT_0053390659 /DNA_START=165 /DNA_END=418 /DNA_ORIENTATION=-
MSDRDLPCRHNCLALTTKRAPDARGERGRRAGADKDVLPPHGPGARRVTGLLAILSHAVGHNCLAEGRHELWRPSRPRELVSDRL